MRELNVFYKKFVYILVIPFFLLVLWLVLSLLFVSSSSFSVLTSSYNKDNFISIKSGELLAKQKITAHFTSMENNLGIISVRFRNFEHISSDRVVFRLREEGTPGWYDQNTYKVDQFQNNKFFTFGFPIIHNSKGKRYYFEIESLLGKHGDAIGLSEISPVFITQYQFSKHELLGDKRQLVTFILKKLLYNLGDNHFIISSFVYLLPFIFYLLWYFYLRKYVTIFKQKYIIEITPSYSPVFIYFGSVVLTTVFMTERNMIISLILLLLWIVLIRIYRFESSVSYLFAAIFLFPCPLLVYFNQDAIAETAANWTYYFLVIGVIQSFREFKKKPTGTVDYQMFMTQLIGKRKAD